MRPLLEQDPTQDGRFWARVREVAEAVVTSSSPPAGFVRRELPTGTGRVAAFTGVADGPGRGGTTVVVVVAPRAKDRGPTPSQLRRRFGLTPREAEVALLLAARQSNKEIARRLSIAHHTAWRHTANIMSKLSAVDRREVGRKLMSAGRRVSA